MPKSNLTWYKTKRKRIMKDMALANQTALGHEINESQQTISYRIRNVYPEVLDDLIRILDVIGWEVKEKEEDEE